MSADTTPLQERIARLLCDNNGDDPDDMELYRGDARTIMPLIAAEVRSAQHEAWTDCVSEASALGWLHAPAALDMLDRNPHETGDQA